MLLQCLFIRYVLGFLTLFPVFNLFFVLLIMWVCGFAGERERGVICVGHKRDVLVLEICRV